MDDDYIYRLDDTSKLKAFPDGCHRAPRWPKGLNPYPHKLLEKQHSLLSTDQGIYRICFFVTQAKAEKVRLEYEDSDGTTLARCRKADVFAAGFTDSWDDGFEVGVAHLFWTKEELVEGNGTLSSASIPFDRFEALVDGDWLPLPTYLAPTVPPTQSSGSVVPPAKRSLASRIMAALRSNQST